MTRQPEDELVKVRLRLTLDGAPGGESLWAKPVDAHEGGGTYRVGNNAFFASLMVGDVVRAELDGYSRLQVTGIEHLWAGMRSCVEYPDDTSSDLIQSTADSWKERGAVFTEGGANLLTTNWPEELTAAAVRSLLAETVPSDWTVHEVDDEATRAQLLPDEPDFELVRSDLEATGPVDYWAADDPGWAAVGVTDPGALAYLQTLAVADARVLATIRAGQHQNVLRYLERLTEPDPRTLPPLEGPLLLGPPS